MENIRISKTLKQFSILISLCFAVVNPGFSNTPQTHDVPAFHNDDGLGLLQDCTFMKARATGSITSDVPTTVAGRSVGCLTSIKSVAQLLFSLQKSKSSSEFSFANRDSSSLFSFLWQSLVPVGGSVYLLKKKTNTITPILRATKSGRAQCTHK